MRFCILCQEEPVFLGPVVQRVMELHPDRVAAVLVAGRRGAGEKSRTWNERWESLRIFWNILEPSGFVAALLLRLRARLLGAHDPRSVRGTARRLGISVHEIADCRTAALVSLLRELQADLVLNQAEVLLTGEALRIPRLGFINRHASLLPDYRGRMGAFWSHAAENPRYGVTIHFVDEGIDTGPIILQQEFHDVDPSWPYPKVMRRLCAAAPQLIWEAVALAETGGVTSRRSLREGGAAKPSLFPTLAQAQEYRKRLSRRRRGVTEKYS